MYTSRLNYYDNHLDTDLTCSGYVIVKQHMPRMNSDADNATQYCNTQQVASYAFSRLSHSAKAGALGRENNEE